MAIQNIPAVAERIDLGDGDFITVRALTLGELAAVFDPVMRQVAAVFDRAVKADPRELLNDRALINDLVSILLRQAPGLIARILAVAADVPNREDEVARLPFPSALLALEQMVRLTSPDRATMAALMARLGDQASGHSSAITRMRTGNRGSHYGAALRGRMH